MSKHKTELFQLILTVASFSYYLANCNSTFGTVASPESSSS